MAILCLRIQLHLVVGSFASAKHNKRSHVWRSHAVGWGGTTARAQIFCLCVFGGRGSAVQALLIWCLCALLLSPYIYIRGHALTWSEFLHKTCSLSGPGNVRWEHDKINTQQFNERWWKLYTVAAYFPCLSDYLSLQPCSGNNYQPLVFFHRIPKK